MTCTTPDWTSLAADALIRLRADHTLPDKPSGAQAVCEAGDEPLGADAQDQTRSQGTIPARKLLLTLRLCATLGTSGRVAALLTPGAVTVLELGDVDPDLIRDLLETTLMPEGVAVTDYWPTHPREDKPVLCAVFLSETSEPRARDKALKQVSKALELPHPVIILAQTLAGMPEDILRLLRPSMRLAPLSRDILMAHLRASHRATGELDDQLRARLPENRALARLSWPVLAAALRAPLAGGVAERLREATEPVATDGPTLADIEGYGAAEGAARQMVADLQGWSEGRVPWDEVQRSVLFHGVPGTGKSYLARAMSNSAGVVLVRGSFAAWQAKGNLSHMLHAMRASFAEAAAARPAILVIDEIDAVGDRADPDPHNASYRHQVINGFLEQMDGLKQLEGVLVVGTCNYPGKIDAAVLRAGRFDIKVDVPLPGAKALARMLRDGLPGETSQADLARLTRAAAGQSAADVDGALRQARAAARAQARAVEVADVMTALGPEPQDDNPARDRRVAIHECGHAIVGTCLRVGKIHRLTLTAEGGQAWIRFSMGEGLLSEHEAELAYTLAGRAAETLILGEAAAGAGGGAVSDLALATSSAVRIDTRFGLGAEGPTWLDIPHAVYLRDPRNAARIRARLENAEAYAMGILEGHRDLLLEMAATLEKHRMLEGEALENWLERIPASQTILEGADGSDAPNSSNHAS